MLNLRHLQYFVAVVDAGSFSRAAQLIHVAQPSLSQQIAALESDVGATLLQRSARGVRPTSEGELLYREAVTLIRRIEAIPAMLRQSASEPAGVVTVGMSSTIASVFATAILTACEQSLPKVRIVLRSADSEVVATAIHDRTIDLGVVFEAEPLPRLSRRELYRQRLFLFGADPGLLARAARSLDGISLVLPTQPNVTRRAVDRILTVRGLAADVGFEATNYSDMLSAVRVGSRVTVIPKGHLDETTPGLAVPVPIEPAEHLTAVIVSSDEYPLSRAGEAVGALVERVIFREVARGALRGAEPARSRPTDGASPAEP